MARGNFLGGFTSRTVLSSESSTFLFWQEIRLRLCPNHIPSFSQRVMLRNIFLTRIFLAKLFRSIAGTVRKKLNSASQESWKTFPAPCIFQWIWLLLFLNLTNTKTGLII